MKKTQGKASIGLLGERQRAACEALAKLGYGQRSVAAYARVLDQLEIWLAGQGLPRPTEQAVGRFIVEWRAGGPALKGLREISEYLVLAGATSADALAEVAGALEAYRH